MKAKSSTGLGLLRSRAQESLLAEVLLHPDEERSLSELAQCAGTSLPTVSREIERAERAGVIATRSVGRTRLARASTESPLYAPLRQLIELTFGVPAIIASEFERIAHVRHLYLFGSWAARAMGEERDEPVDIDVLVVGEPNRDDVYDAADRAEGRLRRPVQVAIRTPAQWKDASDPFLSHLRSRPLVRLLGVDSDAP
jgi:predicted nucleotidyltransferase